MQPSTQPAEEYPKVAEESAHEVIIDFTDTEKKEAEISPPPAEGKKILEDPGPEYEVNPEPDVTAPATETAPADSGPALGSTNEDGAVYDTVFGWVVPGKVEQTIMDSDGDSDKMVGNMGE